MTGFGKKTGAVGSLGKCNQTGRRPSRVPKEGRRAFTIMASLTLRVHRWNRGAVPLCRGEHMGRARSAASRLEGSLSQTLEQDSAAAALPSGGTVSGWGNLGASQRWTPGPVGSRPAPGSPPRSVEMSARASRWPGKEPPARSSNTQPQLELSGSVPTFGLSPHLSGSAPTFGLSYHFRALCPHSRLFRQGAQISGAGHAHA